MAPRAFRVLRSIAAGVLAFAAVNHLVLAARGSGDVPRHVVFVLVNAALAVVLVSRPRWALAATMLLALQQIPSHGEDLVASLGSQLDWASLAVVLFFPALIMLLAVERTASRPEPPTAGPRGP